MLTRSLFFQATKTDLKKNSKKPLISTEEGKLLSRKILANNFVECSAKENYHIQQVIHEALRAAIEVPVNVDKSKKATTNQIVMIGDGCIGKSFFFKTYINGSFVDNFITNM